MSNDAEWVWMVTGDHPIGKRPDKMFGSGVEAGEYAEELKSAGYENISIKGQNSNDAVR